MPPADGIEILFGECAREVAATAAARMGPQALAPLSEPVALGTTAPPPRRYVVSLRDRAIPAAFQRRMAEDGGCVQTTEIDTDHSPFLSRPDELAAILHSFAVSEPRTPSCSA